MLHPRLGECFALHNHNLRQSVIILGQWYARMQHRHARTAKGFLAETAAACTACTKASCVPGRPATRRMIRLDRNLAQFRTLAPMDSRTAGIRGNEMQGTVETQDSGYFAYPSSHGRPPLRRSHLSRHLLLPQPHRSHAQNPQHLAGRELLVATTAAQKQDDCPCCRAATATRNQPRMCM